jgi:hypothetical protein
LSRIPRSWFDRAALHAAGFTGVPGTTLALPAKAGAPRVLVGVGDPAALDESGVRDAAAAFAGTVSWIVRPALDVAVAGRLMCTDNMPSGTALKLGDVLTARGGTTVEVTDTDAEGRLTMVLAAEERPDASR